jgi:glycosyltransferase involved in cell wall biosynthesis
VNHKIVFISVVVCTHNPRPNYLSRVLEALKAQTLPQEDWELLIVDNASKSAVSTLVDLGWHSNAAIIRENELGLTQARLRGIKESRGDLIVFVDDDNLLFDDYLVCALEIARSGPKIGVFGAGIIRPEFETTPEDQLRPHLHRLALREVNEEVWAGLPNFGLHLPYGAGLCATRVCANLYVEGISRVSRAKELDRRGECLNGAGDLHFGLTACLHGYLAGVTPKLRVVHMIPAGRCTLDYLIRIAEEGMYSLQLLHTLILEVPPAKQNPVIDRVRFWRRRRQLTGLDRSIFVAEQRGLKRAVSELRSRSRVA